MNCNGRVMILIVERDPYIQALQSAVLKPHGFETIFVPDGETALIKAQELHPRLLIADILVSKLDGLQVCRRIKSAPETRDIIVLIFTELYAERRAREAGADAFLRKPLDQRVFLAKVKELLGIPALAGGRD